MTLDDLKSTGSIPTGIDNDELLRICSSLGFNISKGMQTKLTDYQISKLNYCDEVNDIRIKETVTSKHKEVIEMYNGLEKKYQAIIDQMKSNHIFLQEQKELEELVKQIQTDKEQYKRGLGSLRICNREAIFNINKAGKVTDLIGSISSARDITEDSRAKRVDIKIEELEGNLQSLASSNTKSIVNKIKINHIAKKLSRLQAKKGSIRDKQQRIFSSSTDLYVGLMNKKFTEYAKHYDRVAAKFDEKAQVNSKISNLYNSANNLKKGNMILEASRSGKNIFQQISINREQRHNNHDIKKIERQIKRLKTKRGKIDVKSQAIKAKKGTFSR